MSSGKKNQSTEAPTKKLSKLIFRNKQSKEARKKASVESFKKGEEALRTCDESELGSGSSSPNSVKKKKKSRTPQQQPSTTTVEEDETTSKAKKSKASLLKEEDKTSKIKRKSKKKEQTREEEPQQHQVSGMATLFEPVNAAIKPAVDKQRDLNAHIKGDMERLEKEAKKEKEKLKASDQKSPKHEVEAVAVPSLREGINVKPVYQQIPNKDAKVSCESLKTGKEGSKKAEEQSSNDSHDDGADCKTAMIPPKLCKINTYQKVMVNGIPRYEPVINRAEKSEKEVAAKIQILPRPAADRQKLKEKKVTTPPAKSPSTPPPPATIPPPPAATPPPPAPAPKSVPKAEVSNGAAPKDQPPADTQEEKKELLPVSHYVAKLD